MSSNPLPCPFCGCEKITVSEGTAFRWVKAECDDCGASCGEVRINTMKARDEDEIRCAVIEKWNNRYNV